MERNAEARTAGGLAPDPAAAHRTAVEHVLCGLDINTNAVQMTAANLALGAPEVNFKRLNICRMPYGTDAEGVTRAGSLELLSGTGGTLGMLAGLREEDAEIAACGGTQIEDATAGFPVKRRVDIVVMNPPFSNTARASRNQSEKQAQKALKDRLHKIKADYEVSDPHAARAMKASSVTTFFAGLADAMLKPASGALGMLGPTTACVNSSSAEERRLLGEHFHIERIVVGHDPRHPNFSCKKDNHEVLITGRRKAKAERGDTEIVALRRMPETATEAAEVAELVEKAAGIGDWGRVHRIDRETIEAGDWSAVLWYDAELIEAVRTIHACSALQPLGQRHAISSGALPQRVSDCYQRHAGYEPGRIPGWGTISTDVKQTLSGTPDSWFEANGNPERDAMRKRLLAGRGNALLCSSLRTNTCRVTAQYSEEPSFGTSWVPVKNTEGQSGKALTAWWNSTPARIAILARPAGADMAFPQWSQDLLKTVPVPRKSKERESKLAEAYEAVQNHPLERMDSKNECAARKVLDDAAADVMGIRAKTVKKWRHLLDLEPRISGAARDETNR